MMSITMRSTICTAEMIPCQVMWRSSHTSATGVPVVKNMFMMAVNATMMYTGFRPRVRAFHSTLDSRMQTASTTIMMP